MQLEYLVPLVGTVGLCCEVVLREGEKMFVMSDEVECFSFALLFNTSNSVANSKTTLFHTYEKYKTYKFLGARNTTGVRQCCE